MTRNNTLIRRDHSIILGWLVLCASLVALMVLVGGFTRLSGSGLSITSWKPLHGALPPLSQEAWLEEFAAYQQSPQYVKVNAGMTLDEFKTIFWPEFIHRLLGRMIGIIFFLPLVVFAARKSIATRFSIRLAAIFALGGLQGIIGWLMVKSGLIDDPNVSHLRLGLHLAVAFALFAAMLWAVMDVMQQKLFTPTLSRAAGEGTTLFPLPLQRERVRMRALTFYIFWFFVLSLQILLGAFLAGLHGGTIYNTWPDMNGQLVPPEAYSSGAWWNNIALIQFLHRTNAIFLALGFGLWWYYYRDYVRKKHLASLCFGMQAVISVQFVLGVMTLLLMAPLPLALAHQMTALLLFGTGVVLLYEMKRR